MFFIMACLLMPMTSVGTSDVSNADAYLDLPEIASRHGYRAETHEVVTDDGYILRLHRISSIRSNFKGSPVLLQHGLLESSVDWIINGNNSLGFLLADEGYDVWLGNARGNKYSRAHVTIPTEQARFWNFSFHEMGVYDLPAVIFHINNRTRKAGEIVYIGHSMGSTMYLVFSSTLPEVAKNVKISILLAPIAFLTNIQSVVKYLAYYVNFLQWFFRILNINEVFANNIVWSEVLPSVCVFLLGQRNCLSLLFVAAGFNSDDFNWKIASVFTKQDPAGTSINTLVHYGQIINQKDKFQKFDYGESGNMIKYGTRKPPNYQLNKIKSPIYLMYGNKDPLGDAADVQLLAKTLPNLKGLQRVAWDSFSHLDFLFSIYAETYVYRPIMTLISNYTS